MFDWYDELFPAAEAASTASDASGMVDMTGFQSAGNDAAQYFGNDSYGELGSGFSGIDASSMGDLYNTNSGLGSGMGDALGSAASSFGSSSASDGDWLSTLGSQLGDKLFNKKDPLSSLTSLVGALGAIRNITGKQHSDLPEVQKLFDKGASSPYKAANTIKMQAPLRGRTAQQFIAPTPAVGGLSLIKKG